MEQTPLNNNEERVTRQQQKAMHLWFSLLAETLEVSGLDLKQVLTMYPVNISATKENVKEVIWRPVMKALYGKESTTELLKKEEIDKVYETIARYFAEMGLEVPRFPSAEEMLIIQENTKL